MFDEDDFNNTAVDLDRVRKLAGLPEVGDYKAPADTFDAEDEFELDSSVSAAPAPSVPLAGDFDMGEPLPAPEPVAMTPAAPSHWTAVLGDLEAQLDSIPVGEFRDVIDGLRHLANYAEDIRRTLITEGRKTFADYVAENTLAPIKPTTSGTREPQTLGANRADAIQSLQARMGADAATATKKFDAMHRKGMVKNAGGAFTMDTMDDEEFTAAVNDPMLDK